MELLLDGLANKSADLESVITVLESRSLPLIWISFATLQKELETTHQGVYGAVVIQEDEDVEFYTGSSYGKLGLQNRVFKNHLDPAYRAREPYKALYMAMARPGAKTYFIALAVFKQRVPAELVLLAEATFMLLFGSLKTRISQVLTNPSPPAIFCEGGLIGAILLVPVPVKVSGTTKPPFVA